MKLSVAALVLVLVATSMCQARPHKRSLKSAWHSMANAGQNAIRAVKKLAVKLKNISVGVAGKVFQTAKKAFSTVVHSGIFEEAVNRLIPLITSEMSLNECTLFCEGFAEQIPKVGEELGRSTCPTLCAGALAKLEEAARKLADKLEHFEDDKEDVPQITDSNTTLVE